MSDINLGDVVPQEPDYGDVVKGVVLQMFQQGDPQADTLAPDQTGQFANQPLTFDLRDQVLSALNDAGFKVPDDKVDSFWQAGFPVWFRLQRSPDDPWTDENKVAHLSLTYTQTLDFTEGVSNTNYSGSHQVTSQSWARADQAGLTVNATADPVPSPYYGFGSDGIPWSCTYTLSYSPGMVTCTATLTSTTYTYLAGTAVTQTRSLSLTDVKNGMAMFFFWTGVWFPAGPIGLVRSLGLTVFPRTGFTD